MMATFFFMATSETRSITEITQKGCHEKKNSETFPFLLYLYKIVKFIENIDYMATFLLHPADSLGGAGCHEGCHDVFIMATFSVKR